LKVSKPILVTGATGSIGSVLVKRLCASGQFVRALVRNPDRAAELRSMANVEILPGDLSRPDSLSGCAQGCSLVYHCAAKLSGSDWKRSQAINVTGTQAIAAEAAHAGVERFIYTSTIGVYGLSKAENITEETPWSKYNLPYFTTKQAAERLVWEFKDQIPFVVARVGDVVGPGQHTWTIDLIERINQGMYVTLPDSESGWLNPVYIDNLVDALLLMGVHPAAPGQAFNIVDGTPILASDYFNHLARMAGRRIAAIPAIVMKAAAALLMGFDRLRGREATTTPGSVDYLLRIGKIYPDKLRAALGWSPAILEEEATHLTEQWLRHEGYITSM
jgi:nucleoside-diphosphate-sugar epimerase